MPMVGRDHFFEDHHFYRRYHACAAFHRRQSLTWGTEVYTPLHSTSKHKNNMSQKSRSEGWKEPRIGYSCSRAEIPKLRPAKGFNPTRGVLFIIAKQMHSAVFLRVSHLNIFTLIDRIYSNSL